MDPCVSPISSSTSEESLELLLGSGICASLSSGSISQTNLLRYQTPPSPIGLPEQPYAFSET